MTTENDLLRERPNLDWSTAIRGRHAGQMGTMETIHVITTPERHRTELDVEMTTARLGDKWLHRLNVGDEVQICRCEGHGGPCTLTGRAVITGLDLRPFADLPNDWIEKNHSLGSNRNMDALADAMAKAYGRDFDEFSNVTTIFYKRVENY